MDAAKRKTDTPRRTRSRPNRATTIAMTLSTIRSSPRRARRGGAIRMRSAARRTAARTSAKTQPAICDAIRSLPAPAPEFAPKPKAGIVRPRTIGRNGRSASSRVMLPGVDGPVRRQRRRAARSNARRDASNHGRSVRRAHERALKQLAGALPQKEGHRDRSPLNDWSAVCADKLEAEGFRVADRTRPLVVAVLVDHRHGGGGGGGGTRDVVVAARPQGAVRTVGGVPAPRDAPRAPDAAACARSARHRRSQRVRARLQHRARAAKPPDGGHDGRVWLDGRPAGATRRSMATRTIATSTPRTRCAITRPR